MNTEEIERRKLQLDDIAHRDENGIEFWYAREIQEALNYKEWRNFEVAIKRAIEAAENANTPARYHFVEVNKMVSLGSGSQREVKDYKLTRYACYLIAMNGDTRKEEIAFAQSYFAVLTRKQELIAQRMNEIKRLQERQSLSESEVELSRIAYEHGVDDKGFGIIRSKGDAALFGGYNTANMKKRLGVSNGPLADRLPAITITAKSLAAQMTSMNVENNNICGTAPIANEHVINNKGVRKTLTDRGIYPENLPPEEDTKKVDRRIKSETKKLSQERFKEE